MTWSIVHILAYSPSPGVPVRLSPSCFGALLLAAQQGGGGLELPAGTRNDKEVISRRWGSAGLSRGTFLREDRKASLSLWQRCSRTSEPR